MALDKAHEGYEYQDLLSAYFILKEILSETDSKFTIDRKEFGDDKLDDLLVSNSNGKFKRQIKYSGNDTNHTFVKANIAANSTYNLSLDSLYNGWLKNPEKGFTEFRLCLAWNEPVDELKTYLKLTHDHQTFPDFPTKIFKVNGKAIWPEGKTPVSSWKQFKKASASIDRDSFLNFCDSLLIEVELPKFSLNLNSPGDLEKLLLGQAKQIGVGIFPNDHIKPETFILSLVAIIKRARSKGTIITIAAIFHELNIRVDYGKIEQKFPVIESENLYRKDAIETFISEINKDNKVVLTGEPGSGKSWFIENLQNLLSKKGIKVIRHYCYTQLDDILQQERIKLNIFYGNLINDIIQAYPELKVAKKEKYASNLNELNILLQRIIEPTYLIIDGLDHIDRIFNFRQFTDIASKDIAIIDNIQMLKTSPNLKIIVVSQNIPQLDKLSDYKKLFISNWFEKDIKKLLTKLKIKNKKVKRETSLSAFLFERSSGNPLYIKYLIDEIKRNPKNLEILPAYSFNLREYYVYLVSQIETSKDVPQVLSGVSFSLTKKELEEITGSGKYVSKSLDVLSPVLKLNLSQSGYIIYHESFRRFIIDQLKENAVSIEKKVFSPVIEWFDSKDFFAYRKAYRYCLSFLFDSGEFKKMLEYLKYSFVTDSVINGQPWELIEKNYKYFVKATCKLKDFSNVVLLNEISKILSSTEDSFTQVFPLYIEALGKIYGFNFVSEYLVFEGNPSYALEEGLKVCYICDENNVAAPWELYMSYFKDGGKIEKDNFSFFVRGLLVLKKEDKLNSLSKKLKTNSIEEFTEIFKEEIQKYSNKDFTDYLSDKYPNIKNVVNLNLKLPLTLRNDVLLMADEILKFEHIYSKEAPVLENFLSGVLSQTTDDKLFAELINKFKGINWFYNWIIYNLKIISFRNIPNPSYFKIKEAFDFLQYTTEPFVGEPRACDLHPIQHIIYDSFQKGLELIKFEDQWKEIIDILVKVSRGTTTSLQRSQGGPLTADRLFKLLSEFACENNLSYINSVFEELSKEKEEYHLHLDIAEYNFRLSSLFISANDRNKAIAYFKKAVEYTLAYTMRKDMTLHDVIEGIEPFATIDAVNGLEDLKATRILVDSAVDHTDGKETHYFPILWFEKFIRIDFKKAALFLLNELSNCRYDWRAEKSLVDLLCTADCKIDPVTEFYLACTFPVNDSGKFVSYCLNLYDTLCPINPSFAEKLIARVIPSVQPRQNRRFSDNTVERINDKIESGGYDKKFKIPKENHTRNSSRKNWYDTEIVVRKEFSLMSFAELIAYFEENGIKQNDVHPLTYLFSQYEDLTDSLKEIIQTVVSKNSRSYSDKIELDVIFSTGNDIECYYWVCRFFYDLGGWFERFVNQQAFQKANEIDSVKTLEYLFNLLPSGLNIEFKFDFSANLIKALVAAGYDKAVITSMWKNLFEITSYRLPKKDEIEWDNILNDELEMDTEEILVSILICRFKAATTERFQWATSALRYLLANKPDILLKPLKWYFSKRTKFGDSVLCIILQLLLEQKERGFFFHQNFTTEFQNIFPKHYFIIDYMLSKLLNAPLPGITSPKGLIYPSMPERDYDFFIRLNRRFRPIENCSIDLEKVFCKYVTSFKSKYEDFLELYYSRAYKTTVPHIYTSEYLLELMNTELYNEFKLWSNVEDERISNYALLIDVNSIITHINSFALRPSDLPKPYEYEKPYSKINDIQRMEWIRLGHYEVALKDEGGLRSRQFKSFGGMVFSEAEIDSKMFPYSDYSIYPFHIWGDIIPEFELDKTIVFAILQDDALEFYKILWLNPRVVKLLGLRVENKDLGLVAIDNSDEIVLKMRTWSCEYIGDSFRTSLSDEIPRFQGTDLSIRKDYFEKLCKHFNEQPSYRVVKMEWPEKNNSEDE
ncbi:MAG: ATP-binding protein [Ferruginibacter sp.]|nr:ATP-binding protein [Ferruginibacter sp.]